MEEMMSKLLDVSRWQPVNARDYKNAKQLDETFKSSWMYVGRGQHKKGLKRSVLANQWSSRPWAKAIIVKDKETAVANFKRWLWQEMKRGNKEVLDELRNVKAHTVMVCHCDDDVCHSKVVWKAAKWLREQEAGKSVK
jgi:hypothetical protein